MEGAEECNIQTENITRRILQHTLSSKRICKFEESHLYLFSEKGRKTQKGYEYTATNELTCIKCVYD